MRNLFSGLGLGVALIVGSTSVYADGMPSRGRAIAAPPPCAQFGGFYIGAHGAWNTYTSRRNDLDGYTNIATLTTSASFTEQDDSFGGGAQVGYNFQSRCSLWGIEGDFSWSRLETRTNTGNAFNAAAGVAFQDSGISSNIDWIATIRTRTGIIVDNTLLYLTGGFAFADVETRFRHNHPFAGLASGFSFSDTQVGFVAGGGVEIALSRNISLKSEVLYMNFGDWKRSGVPSGVEFAGPPVIPFSFSGSDEVWSTRTGINWRF